MNHKLVEAAVIPTKPRTTRKKNIGKRSKFWKSKFIMDTSIEEDCFVGKSGEKIKRENEEKI